MHSIFICRVSLPEEFQNMSEVELGNELKEIVYDWLAECGDENNWCNFLYAFIEEGKLLDLGAGSKRIKEPITAEKDILKFAKEIRFENTNIPSDKKEEYVSGDESYCILLELETLRNNVDHEIEYIKRSEKKTYEMSFFGNGLRKSAKQIINTDLEDFPFCRSYVSPYESRVVDLAYDGEPYGYVVLDIHT